MVLSHAPLEPLSMSEQDSMTSSGESEMVTPTDESMPTAGLGLLAAAASAPTLGARVGAVHGKGEEELDADESDDDEGLVVASAVVESLHHAPPTDVEQGQIIARQQKEIAALRELVASQAAAIEHLRAAAACVAPHGPHPPGTSPPPPYGPASPSSELISAAEELDALSPSHARHTSRLPSGLGHSQGFYLPQHALSDGSAKQHSDARALPTPQQHRTATPTSERHHPHHFAAGPSYNALLDAPPAAKRLKSHEASSAPSPRADALPYAAVTLSLHPYRTTVMGKAQPRMGRTNTHVLWTVQEDECLRRLVAEHGEQAWALVASRMPHERNNKQCRERWRNHLRPQCNKGPWTDAEDLMILEMVQQHGTKWAKISSLYLPDRPENDIKNRWHILVRLHQHSANGTQHGASAVGTAMAGGELTYSSLARPGSALGAATSALPPAPAALAAFALASLDSRAIESA